MTCGNSYSKPLVSEFNQLTYRRYLHVKYVKEYRDFSYSPNETTCWKLCVPTSISVHQTADESMRQTKCGVICSLPHHSLGDSDASTMSRRHCAHHLTKLLK